MKWIKDEANVRSIIGLLLFGMFMGILMTLIVNPKSLNPEVNHIIDIFIGALLVQGNRIIEWYFRPTRKNERIS